MEGRNFVLFHMFPYVFLYKKRGSETGEFSFTKKSDEIHINISQNWTFKMIIFLEIIKIDIRLSYHKNSPSHMNRLWLDKKRFIDDLSSLTIMKINIRIIY